MAIMKYEKFNISFSSWLLAKGRFENLWGFSLGEDGRNQLSKLINLLPNSETHLGGYNQVLSGTGEWVKISSFD